MKKLSASLYILKTLKHVIHCFYPQNGICIQKYHFWPKYDDEKWSSKIYFEIPSCGKIVVFITDFRNFYEIRESMYMEEFQKYSCRPLFTIILRPKIVSLDTDFILRGKTMYESVK